MAHVDALTGQIAAFGDSNRYADCTGGMTPQYCNTMNSTCADKQPDGQPCSGNDACLNGFCDTSANPSVCASIIGSGNGLICAARPGGSSGGEGAGGLLLVGLAVAGLSRRRRR